MDGVFGSTDAAGLDQHVILAGERHGTERDHQEQVGRVRLNTLPVKDVTLLRPAAENGPGQTLRRPGSDSGSTGVRHYAIRWPDVGSP